eukprot:TRINITY_DN30920_c0_g1_i1.p1 TRINITY_DN30920_c0_g1~~TRINITY_DN30920_c0_g1_i1.p1  ORF type:complete len:174 (+),score=14.09 TRINITY_DN30920_c0_g1_i1:37-558(+)
MGANQSQSVDLYHFAQANLLLAREVQRQRQVIETLRRALQDAQRQRGGPLSAILAEIPPGMRKVMVLWVGFRLVTAILRMANGLQKAVGKRLYAWIASPNSPPLTYSPTVLGTNDTDLGHALACVACQTHQKDTLLYPCYHLCLCWQCSSRMECLEFCPICRTAVSTRIFVYC